MSSNTFEEIVVGQVIEGTPMDITKESIRNFAEASLDYNPLHLDPKYMETTNFGKTKFGEVIMHGMTNFACISRMMTDWLWPRGGIYRRLQTRWLKPVFSGDTIVPKAIVLSKKKTLKGQWVVFEIEVKTKTDRLIATGEATAEFPL